MHTYIHSVRPIRKIHHIVTDVSESHYREGIERVRDLFAQPQLKRDRRDEPSRTTSTAIKPFVHERVLLRGVNRAQRLQHMLLRRGISNSENDGR